MKFLSRPAPASSRAAVAAAVAAFALAGCANYFDLKDVKQIASTSQFEATQSLPAQGGEWPALDWSNQFGDPQLPRLIEEALEGNPSIAQAQARIAKASSYIESSKSALYPKVEGSYSWTRELYSANALFPPPYGGTWYSENNVLASASWDLDLWGKNRQRLGQAVSQEKAAEADMQQARVTLAASVARTYNSLAQLYALRDIAEREIKNRQTIGTITNDRVRAGLDTNVERQTANGNIATSQANLTELDGQITTTRYELGALLGKGPDRGLQIAKPVFSWEPGVMWRENRDYAITVQSDIVEGLQGATVTGELLPKLQALEKTWPLGYAIQVAGAVEESSKGQGSIAVGVPIMLFITFTLLMLQLHSFSRSMLVFITGPLGIAGVAGALLLLDRPFGFVALLGVIALMGMIQRNSVILIDQIEQDRARGVPTWDAIVESAVRRLRPIVLTAAAAVLAMIPLSRSVFWGPMAVAIMGGLVVATVLTLLALPAMYAAWFRVKREGAIAAA